MWSRNSAIADSTSAFDDDARCGRPCAGEPGKVEEEGGEEEEREGEEVAAEVAAAEEVGSGGGEHDGAVFGAVVAAACGQQVKRGLLRRASVRARASTEVEQPPCDAKRLL